MLLIYLVCVIVCDLALIYLIDLLGTMSQSTGGRLSDWIDVGKLVPKLQFLLVVVLPPAYYWRHRFKIAGWIFNLVWHSATKVFFWGIVFSSLIAVAILFS